jgi:multiple sugar transport system permease protein
MEKSMTSVSQKSIRTRLSPGYIFVAPAVVLILLMAIYPTFRVLFLSVMDYSRRTRETTFVGLANYQQLLADPIFSKVFKQTLYFSIFSSVGHVGLGLALALIMNSDLNRRFVSFNRAIILLPWALSPVVVAIITQLWAYPLTSPIGKVLTSWGLTSDFAPLARTGTALMTLTLINIWQFTPFFMLMVLAGLQTIDPELENAAMVDGANGFQRFRFITLPHIRNILLTLMLFDLVTTAAYFDLIWVTTQGGPVRSTEVLATYIYRIGFLTLDWNRAATIGVILLVLSIIMAAMVVVQLREDQ